MCGLLQKMINSFFTFYIKWKNRRKRGCCGHGKANQGRERNKQNRDARCIPRSTPEKCSTPFGSARVPSSDIFSHLPCRGRLHRLATHLFAGMVTDILTAVISKHRGSILSVTRRYTSSETAIGVGHHVILSMILPSFFFIKSFFLYFCFCCFFFGGGCTPRALFFNVLLVIFGV